MDLGPVREIIEKHDFQKSALIGILQDIQAEMHYLPQKALVQVSKSLDIPLTQVYEVATFYKAFSLEPRGKRAIKVCLGTACHVRGGGRVLDYLENRLGIKAGETTEDLSFSLEAVNCLGTCALGPVMAVDKRYYGHMHTSKFEPILKEYQTGNR